ncbi:MAG TPA: 3-deoxy-D-manno-octulosonic acid transferase [Candidatus Saccharimonadales bacterium]|nr:3-deoxy-D-manno-octulosonic acid transferase [Candidatus Saccharimonadales bacterium]
MRFGYNILFILFFWLSAPYYFWKMWRRGNWRAGFAQRFGHYDPALKTALAQRPVVWLHAVSVGEVGVCWQLIRALDPHLSGCQILVSTTTSTGMAELQRLLPPHIHRIYYPADFFGVIRRSLKAIQPRAIILVEAELWPNFLTQAVARGCPLFLVNARISERSFRNYRSFGFFFRPIFARFRGVGCQQQQDSDRLVELGFPAGSVRVTGNLKFDAAQPDAGVGLDVRDLLRQIGVGEKAVLLVAGSTHAGEEAIMAEMFPRLRARFPALFLVLVPRHFERAKEVAQELEARGMKFIYRSAIGASAPAGERQCLLVNTTGELKFFYRAAALVFVGKSLTARGGQNPIEPAALGKAILFGPNMQNFASVTRALIGSQAAIQVQNAVELEQAIVELLGDDQRRSELGARAMQVVQQNLGATPRTVEFILERLSGQAGSPQ